MKGISPMHYENICVDMIALIFCCDVELLLFITELLRQCKILQSFGDRRFWYESHVTISVYHDLALVCVFWDIMLQYCWLDYCIEHHHNSTINGWMVIKCILWVVNVYGQTYVQIRYVWLFFGFVTQSCGMGHTCVCKL